MARLIFWALLGLVAIWLVRRALRRPPDTAASAGTDTLVRCAHCGVHLPDDESVGRDGRRYCSEDHARRGPEQS